MATYCFYHSSDLDGKCSGFLVSYLAATFDNVDVITIPIDYNDKFQHIFSDSDVVYMVDFSLSPFSEMIDLHEFLGDNFIWIDHHITSITEYIKYGKNIRGLREVGKAACELVWEYFTKGEKEIPEFVHYLGRYDVWDYEDFNVLPFQYGMRLESTNFDDPDTGGEARGLWLDLIECSDQTVDDIIVEGKVALKYLDSYNKEYIDKCGFELEFEDRKVFACNANLANLKLFDNVPQKYKYDMFLTFGFKKDIWTVSLYTDKEDVDVSEIAKKHGGGGHRRAAGFSCKKLPFELSS